MTPTERLKRLRELQRTAAAQRQAEYTRPRDIADGLAGRIEHLRLRELRDWLMTGAEIRERHRLEREVEKDRQEEREGDWPR